MLLKRMLGRLYDITLADNEQEALNLATQKRYDMVLMDINLGTKRTGVDVLDSLRDMDHYRQTPVIAVTAYAMPGDRESFLA